jgi:hypothetical protein
MNISGMNSADLLINLAGQTREGSLQAEVGVRMLKKAQDRMTQEGQAMVQMIEQAGSVQNRPYRLDALA